MSSRTLEDTTLYYTTSLGITSITSSDKNLDIDLQIAVVDTNLHEFYGNKRVEWLEKEKI